MINPDQWKPEAERLCREVAGDDLVGVPVYIATYGEIRTYDIGFAPSTSLGWTSQVADLLLCDWLTSRRQWKGRGFACVIDDTRLETFRATLGAVLHELAHYLTAPCQAAPHEQPRATTLPQWFVTGLTTALAKPMPATLPRWYGHELPFVRAACHLAHRAGESIESIRPHHLQFASRYHYPPLNEATFMAATEAELSDPRPIREIIASEPPPQLTQLWEWATDVGPVTTDTSFTE